MTIEMSKNIMQDEYKNATKMYEYYRSLKTKYMFDKNNTEFDGKFYSLLEHVRFLAEYTQEIKRVAEDMGIKLEDNKYEL